MEMATKYQMTDVKGDILEVVEYEWPSKLEAWDERDQHRKSIDAPNPELASVVEVATRYNLPHVRALALYELCKVDPKKEWNNCSRRGARWNLLTSKDYHDLVCIQELQRDTEVFERMSCYSTDSDDDDESEDREDESNPRKRRRKDRDNDRHKKAKMDLLEKRDFLRAMREYKGDLECGRYCQMCHNDVRSVTSVRKTFWSSLQFIAKREGVCRCFALFGSSYCRCSRSVSS